METPIFLGASYRAQQRALGWDLIGLSDVISVPVLPQPLQWLSLAFAIPQTTLRNNQPFQVRARDAARPEVFAKYDVKMMDKSDRQQPPPTNGGGLKSLSEAEPKLVLPDFYLPSDGPRSRSHRFMVLPCPPLMLTEPARILIEYCTDKESLQIGSFDVAFQPTPPISEEERRAIISRPGAIRFVDLFISCPKCNARLTLFKSLNPGERPSGVLGEAVAIEEAPDVWACDCGSARVSLTYLKLGLHNAFRTGAVTRDPRPLKLTPLYERGAIETILERYLAVILGEPTEEAVQQFLQENPILWSFLSPVKILHKPPVLTKKRADFGILSAGRVLYLIEIEKPQTRLVRKSGGVSAELQAGLDQIRDWRVIVGNHRGALLDELGFKSDEVDDVRFLLVAGLAQRTPKEGNTLLRRNPPAEAQLFCFDELAAFLHRIAGELSTL
ncbi:MAG TPA: Shedu anti-phage system protein SduA domain-containing protein [Tepidisphaeraceae bacterium]